MTCSRRDVLCGLGGVAVAGVLMQGCARRVDAAPLLEVGAPVGCMLSLPVARLPALAPDGGAILVQAAGVAAPFLVVHHSGDLYSVYRGLCPHASCPLGVADGLIECPCHGSRFSPDDGSVLNPPAQSALQSYASHLDSTTNDLVIDLTSGDHLPAPAQGKLSLALADYPALANDYGTISGGVAGCCLPLLVARLPGGNFAAVDPTCTHLSCEVAAGTSSLDPSAPRLICPCHGSVFAFDGSVLQGPAARPLTAYPATSDGVNVTIDMTAQKSCAG